MERKRAASRRKAGAFLVLMALLGMLLGVVAPFAKADAPDAAVPTVGDPGFEITYCTNTLPGDPEDCQATLDATHQIIKLEVWGNWAWPTHNTDCNLDRYAAGWAVDWGDNNGNLVQNTKAGISALVGVKDATSLNAADNATHFYDGPNPPRCGVYGAHSDGTYSTGTWGQFDEPMFHRYPADYDIESLQVCVVTYDIHLGTKNPATPKEGDLIAGGPHHAGDNSIEKNGNTPGGNRCFSVFEPPPPPPPSDAAIDLDKTADVDAAMLGQQVTYTFTVTNIGDVDLDTVELTDEDMCDDALVGPSGDTGSDGVLPADDPGPAEVWTYTCHHVVTQAEVDQGFVFNEAEVEALRVDNDEPVEPDEDSVLLDILDVSLTKVSDTEVGTVGETIVYTYVVTNTGTADLTIDTLTDDRCAPVEISPANVDLNDDQILSPNEAWTYTCEYTVTAEDLTAGTVDNIAKVTTNEGPEDTADESVPVTAPGISLVKDGPAMAHRGDEITYDFTVTNTGDTALVTVVLLDAICDDGTIVQVTDGNGDAVLAVGEVWTYECTRVITDTDPDPLPNTAEVTGTDELGREAEATDDHEVDLIAPAIEVVKTVSDENPTVGDTITYTFVVTNTGDTTLFDVDVDDDVLGPIGTIDELEPGESATLTKTMVVETDSPTRNIAVADGEDPLGEHVTDDDDAIITIVAAEDVARALPKTGTDVNRLLALSGVLLLVGGGLLMSSSPVAQRSRRRQ